MNRLMLGTGATANYVDRALPWLERVQAHSVIDTFFVCVDFEPPAELTRHFDRVRFVPFASANDRARNPNYCLQHGSFLDAAGVGMEDVVIFTDGDAYLQRPFTEGELAWLGNVPQQVVCLQYNGGPFDTLLAEAQRIGPVVPVTQMDEVTLRVWDAIPCYNTGVFVARGGTYHRVHQEYIRRHEVIVESFAHYARQQWLLSYVVGQCGFSVWRLPLTFHAHGHFGVPPGVTIEKDVVLYDGDPVAFRHVL